MDKGYIYRPDPTGTTAFRQPEDKKRNEAVDRPRFFEKPRFPESRGQDLILLNIIPMPPMRSRMARM